MNAWTAGKEGVLAALAAAAMGIVILLLAPAARAATTDAPVMLLIQAKGSVTYSPDGEQWKAVRRNKFLYRGYLLKTGPDGECKLLDRDTDEIRTVGADTVVSMGENGLEVFKGRISEAAPAGGIAAFMDRKFARVQKYTAVRRSVSQGTRRDLKTARHVSLSSAYPDVVWESWGPLYSYELTVGKRRFDVPPSTDETIRFTLPEMPPGVYPYRVKVMYKGEVLEQQDTDGEIRGFPGRSRRPSTAKKPTSKPWPRRTASCWRTSWMMRASRWRPWTPIGGSSRKTRTPTRCARF